jgi:hypothetical protein
VLSDPTHIHTVGSLDGQTVGSGPDAVGQTSDGSGDCKDDGVIIVLSHTEVLQ